MAPRKPVKIVCAGVVYGTSNFHLLCWRTANDSGLCHKHEKAVLDGRAQSMARSKNTGQADFSKIVPGAAAPKPKGMQAAVHVCEFKHSGEDMDQNEHCVCGKSRPVKREDAPAPLSIADKHALELAKNLEGKVVKIETADDLARVDGWLQECKAQRDYFEALERPGIKLAHAAWKAQTEKLAAHQKPIEDFEQKCKKAIVAYTAEQERLQREATRAAQAEAEAAELARREELAKELKKAGEKEAAKAITAAPLVVTVQAPAPIVKSTSVNMTERWKFEIIDAAAVPRKYLMVDEKMIAAVVKAEKAGCSIPGVRVYSETDAVHKSKPTGPTGF